MYNHKLGKNSKKEYDTLHPDLQMIVSWGLKYCAVDFGISEGHRPILEQFRLFQKGRQYINGEWVIVNKKRVVTHIDGTTVKGKHNYEPSYAFDFTAWVPHKPELTWDIAHLTYVGASLIMIAEGLHLEGMISHKLRWGGNWDMDGDLADNNLYDRPHLELYRSI